MLDKTADQRNHEGYQMFIYPNCSESRENWVLRLIELGKSRGSVSASEI